MQETFTQPSRLTTYLPSLYQGEEHEFLGRFLCIFEHLLQPTEQIVAELATYFDPSLTPTQFLPWLASWIGIVVDENWPLERQRKLIDKGVHLYRWRGTHRGLREHLKVYAGDEAEITINDAGKDDTDHRFRFRVTLIVTDTEVISESAMRAIIDAQKPAFTSYTLAILPPK